MATAKHTAPKRRTTKARLTRRQGDAVIADALRILGDRLRKPGAAITSPDDTRAWLRLNLATYEQEVFAVMFLDNKHRVLAFEEMFRGSIDGSSVHPREVVKAALRHNAAAVILAHNHPSGVAEPSFADARITEHLRDALSLVDVRLLDHCIVGGEHVTSLKEWEAALAVVEAAQKTAAKRKRTKRAASTAVSL